MKNSLVGAVLAGGESRRLGQDKALLPLFGRPLILHPFEVLRRMVSEVVVVTIPGRSYSHLGLPVVHDRFVGLGPLAGIHAALEFARPRPLFVLACDLPFVTVELVAHVVDWSSSGRAFGSGTDAAAVEARARVAVWEGRRQPLCGLYSASCRQALEARLSAGRLEAWRFLDEIATTGVAVGENLAFYRPDLLLNINSRRDLPDGVSLPSPETAGS
jgi:molybdopterin-guanine dinucleotide biosynthesis protein A